MIEYTTANTQSDLEEILHLQKSNLEVSISSEELQREGFVTVHHNLELLSRMNQPFPHIIAKDKGEVIGYTLVMLRDLEKEIPVLIPMFQQINALIYNGKSLNDSEYFIMGQVCIEKDYRGKGVFKGLYQHMKEVMAGHFEYIITEVAIRNQRSIRAHHKVGFKSIHTYQSEIGEVWEILLWDWN